MSRENTKKYRENNKPSYKSNNTTIVLVVIENPSLLDFLNYFL